MDEIKKKNAENISNCSVDLGHLLEIWYSRQVSVLEITAILIKGILSMCYSTDNPYESLNEIIITLKKFIPEIVPILEEQKDVKDTTSRS